jgi:hypothetical protein
MVRRVTAAISLPVPDHCWDRVTVDRRPWWIPDESPGGLGDPEIWADEAAIDMYARGDAAPAVTIRLSPGADGLSLHGAIVRFGRHREDLYPPVAYRITCRRWSTCNAGRPYYVLRWPD